MQHAVASPPPREIRAYRFANLFSSCILPFDDANKRECPQKSGHLNRIGAGGGALIIEKFDGGGQERKSSGTE